MRSALTGHHFAGYSNRFWKLLYQSGLVPRAVTAGDDRRLPEWGFGVTNLVPRASPGIGALKRAEYDAGRARLVAKIRRWRPELVVLVGVTLYRALFAGRGLSHPVAMPNGGSTDHLPLPLGLRNETLGGVRVFVLPNPSGRNANYAHDEMLAAFRALKSYLDATGGRKATPS